MKTRKNSTLAGGCGICAMALLSGQVGASTTIFRIIEGGSYTQQAPYVVDPHTRLDVLFPGATVPGDPDATSDNQWMALITSDYIIGGRSTLTRARDVMEDWQVNFIDPATPTVNYYATFFSDDAATTVTRAGYPTTLTGGPMAGESIMNNNKLLAVGDDNTLFWDASTGQISLYNYPGGTLQSTTAATSFTTGPYAGQTIAAKLSSMIGYESGDIYFLEGANTVNVYNTSLGFIRTDTVTLSGLLAGNTLGDLVDDNIPGYTYLGWDIGPIVVGVDAPSPVPEPGGTALALLTFGGWLIVSRNQAATRRIQPKTGPLYGV